MTEYTAKNDNHRMGIDKVFFNGAPIKGVMACETGFKGWVDVSDGTLDGDEWVVERKHGIVDVTIKEGWKDKVHEG